jgi:hypothetical protein
MHGRVICSQREWTANLALKNGTPTRHERGKTERLLRNIGFRKQNITR